MYAIIFSFHGFIHSCDALRSFEGNLLQLSIECREKLHPLISELFPESSKKICKSFWQVLIMVMPVICLNCTLVPSDHRQWAHQEIIA